MSTIDQLAKELTVKMSDSSYWRWGEDHGRDFSLADKSKRIRVNGSRGGWFRKPYIYAEIDGFGGVSLPLAVFEEAQKMAALKQRELYEKCRQQALDAIRGNPAMQPDRCPYCRSRTEEGECSRCGSSSDK